MSDQLILADVEAGQYFRELNTGRTGRVLSKTKLGGVVILKPDGFTEHALALYAERTPVELMELVPKDRDKSQLEALEAALEFIERMPVPRGGTYYHVQAEIRKIKGEYNER